MRAILRSLIVWLVLLAVPFQGFATAAALPCATPAAPAAVHDHHAMMKAATGGHHHEAMAHHAATHDGGAVHHAGAKCGSCAACWVGPALASTATAGAGPQPASFAPVPFDAGHAPAGHPSLPERPPRTILA